MDLPEPPKPPVSLSPPPTVLEKPRTHKRVLLLLLLVVVLCLILGGLIMFARTLEVKKTLELFFPSTQPTEIEETSTATPSVSPISASPEPTLTAGNSIDDIQTDLDAASVGYTASSTADLDQDIKSAQ